MELLRELRRRFEDELELEFEFPSREFRELRPRDPPTTPVLRPVPVPRDDRELRDDPIMLLELEDPLPRDEPPRPLEPVHGPPAIFTGLEFASAY